MRTETDTTRAGFGPRAAAFVIDRLLLFIALLIIRIPALISSLFGGGVLSRTVFFRYSTLDILCWLLSAVYFVLLTWFTGSTLGKKVMHLRVVSDGDDPARFLDILYRETVGRFLSGILCVGYLMCLADRQKRAFHDWLCGTCVVYEDVAFRRQSSAVSEKALKAQTAAAGYSVPGASAQAFGTAPDLTRPFPAEEPLRQEGL